MAGLAGLGLHIAAQEGEHHIEAREEERRIGRPGEDEDEEKRHTGHMEVAARRTAEAADIDLAGAGEVVDNILPVGEADIDRAGAGEAVDNTLPAGEVGIGLAEQEAGIARSPVLAAALRCVLESDALRRKQTTQ